MSTSVAVIGGGAWGTALANVVAKAGNDTLLWIRDPARARDIQQTRINATYLPDIIIDPSLRISAALEDLRRAKLVLLVVPTQSLRSVLSELKPYLNEAAMLCLCCKGIERDTGLFPFEIAAAITPHHAVGLLSGPSFADDVARGLPTAVALACRDEKRAAQTAQVLSSASFRVYHTTDCLGVALGGAVKNVLAIACGIVIGRGLGDSARAALMTRGFAEFMRLAEKCGAKAETLMGLSGFGDVALSCASAHSRNFAFGERLGQGQPPAQASAGQLVEGALTVSALVALGQHYKVTLPVSEAVQGVIEGAIHIEQAINHLMMRPLRAETGL
jgi:glycerol-3-phosphate dehydrogenase (NAD(P)+)